MQGTIDIASVILANSPQRDDSNEYYTLLNRLSKKEGALPKVILTSSLDKLTSLQNYGSLKLSQILASDDEAFMLLERMRRMRSSKEIYLKMAEITKNFNNVSVLFIGDIHSDHYLSFMLHISV